MLRSRGRHLSWDVLQKQGMWRYNHAKAVNISEQNVQDVQIPVPWGHVAGRNCPHHHPTVCVLSCPQPPPQSVQHTVHSSAFSCSFQYPISFMSPSSCCHSPFPASHPFYPSFYLSFSNSFYKPVPTQDVTNPVSLPFFFYMQDIPLPLDCLLCFISHTISPTDLLQPSPAPNFRTSPVFLFYFPQFQHHTMLFSNCTPLLVYSLILCPICWWKESSASCSLLLLPRQCRI